MTGITFKRIAPDESRIYDAAGDHVGDVFALDDPLRAGARYFLVHLDEDPRGPCRVHERSASVRKPRLVATAYAPWLRV